MKKLLLLSLILPIVINLFSQTQSGDIVTLNTAITTGGSKVACEKIELIPGFVFEAGMGKSLTLEISNSACTVTGEIKTNVSQNENYIVTIIPQGATQSVSYENGIVKYDRTVDGNIESLVNIQYFDGLGRPVQTVQKGITPNRQNLVTYQEYDSFGRDSKAWLPSVAESNNGAFLSLDNFKSKALATYADSAYSHTVYEASPLNRVLEQYGPGKEWYTNKKSVKMTYLSESIPICEIVGDGLKRTGDYVAGQLYTMKITDEDGNISYEHRNLEGQIIMTTQISNNIKHDTYYVYDDFGNLRYVFPPKADYVVYSGGTFYDNGFGNDAYIYKYDERNRCIKKKLPGCDWINFVYDKADQLIFSQDGEQAIKNEWAFNKYDAFGRVILSGIHKTTESHETLIAKCKDIVVKEEPVLGSPCPAYGYTWNTLSGVGAEGILTVNHYDNYDHLLVHFQNLAYEKKTGYDKLYINPQLSEKDKGYSAKGLLVATRTKLLNDPENREIATTMFYDERGRLIQSKSTNHLGGIESEYIAYSFTGQPIKKLHEHNTLSGNETITELYTYTYDHAGRLSETKHRLNTNAEISLVKNEYDELGRLKFSTAGGHSSLKVENTYNVRSWVKSISSNHFWEKLDYSHGGNISKMEWCQEAKIRNYAFGYDSLSRLKTAVYTGEGKYGTSYEYDKMGNPTKVIREGMVNTNEYGEVDNLTFTYRGNQVLTAKDNAPNKPLISTSYDFKDYSAKVNPEYVYNKNGALTEDPYKGIKITYNMLNLPQSVDVSAIKGSTEYLYSANGEKLQTISFWYPGLSLDPLENTGGSLENPKPKPNRVSSSVTDYIGNKIYQSMFDDTPVLEKTLTGNGYYDYKEKKYYFYLKDHLGNNRAVADANAVISQRTHYYPFGMPFADGAEQYKQHYKYNGKEFDTMHGMNEYDYHARHYDSGRLTFGTMDPLAETEYAWSPYVYVDNNPLRYIDPDGLKKGDPDDPYQLPEVVVTPSAPQQGDQALGKESWMWNIWYFMTGPREYTPSFSMVGKYGVQPTYAVYASGQIFAEKYPNVLSGTPFVPTIGAGSGVLGVIRSATKGRVFWAGGDKARMAAEAFAKANNQTTIGMTKAGQNLTKLADQLPWTEAAPMWGKLSATYANGVNKGSTIHVFQNATEGVSLNSIWRTIEYPILKSKGANIIYHSIP